MTLWKKLFSNLNRTKATAYALGYFYAGASVRQDKIFIESTRKQDLEVLCCLLGLELEIKSSDKGIHHYIEIDDKHTAKKMIMDGWPPTDLPDLKFIKYFFCGYFDCRGGTFADSNVRVVSVISFKTFELAENFSKKMHEYGLGRAKVLTDKRFSNYYYVKYYVKDTEKLLKLLYSDPTIFNKFQRITYREKLSKIKGWRKPK